MPSLHAAAEPARFATDRWIGTWLDGALFLEARLALGGFGAVYRARTAAGEPVAVKILHPWLTDDPTTVARFRREGETLTQLHADATVRTLAVGETDDGVLYIAMELLTGDNLHDRLRRVGVLPWPTAVAITRAVCESLAEAHALGVIHRDLKPSNIHLEAGDRVKVIDFGIAKLMRGGAADDGRELTAAGHMIGTYEYMAPEQLAGEPCDATADVYALGLVLYEMVTGRRPFARATGPAAMMAALLTQSPVPPSIYAAMPPGLDRIVMRCLARAPGDRPASVAQLTDALDAVVAACTSRDEVTVEQPTFDGTTTLVDRPLAPPRFPALPGIAHARPPRRATHGPPMPELWPRPAPAPPAWPPPSASLTMAPAEPAAPGLAWIALVVVALAFAGLVAAIVTVATV